MYSDVIEYDNLELNVHYERDSEGIVIEAIYNEQGIDMYDYYEDSQELDFIIDSINDKLEYEHQCFIAEYKRSRTK